MTVDSNRVNMNRYHPGETLLIKSSSRMKGIDDIPDSNDFEVTWSLLDEAGDEYMQGVAYNLDVEAVPTGAIISMSANFITPEDLPAGEDGTRYYLQWDWEWEDREFSATEEVMFFPAHMETYGIDDIVVVPNRKVSIRAVVATDTVRPLRADFFAPDGQQMFSQVFQPQAGITDRAIYKHDLRFDLWEMTDGLSTRVVLNPVLDDNGWQYVDPVDGLTYNYIRNSSRKIGLLASLRPYVIQWTFSDDEEFVGTSQMWVFNNTMSSFAHEVKLTMERGLRYPGLIESALSNAEYAQFMMMGNDFFNMVEKLTTFELTGAVGPIRAAWLICTCFQICQSRQLEEAIKAFDFSGQSTTLTVDLAPAYEAMRGNFESQIDSVVKPLKRQLVSSGTTSGDGSTVGLKRRVPAALGLTYSNVGTAVWNNRTFHPSYFYYLQ